MARKIDRWRYAESSHVRASADERGARSFVFHARLFQRQVIFSTNICSKDGLADGFFLLS